MPCVGKRKKVTFPYIVNYGNFVGVSDEEDFDPNVYANFDKYLRKIEGLMPVDVDEIQEVYDEWVAEGCEGTIDDKEVLGYYKKWLAWKKRYVGYLAEFIVSTIGKPDMSRKAVRDNYAGREEAWSFGSSRNHDASSQEERRLERNQQASQERIGKAELRKR